MRKYYKIMWAQMARFDFCFGCFWIICAIAVCLPKGFHGFAAILSTILAVVGLLLIKDTVTKKYRSVINNTKKEYGITDQMIEEDVDSPQASSKYRSENVVLGKKYALFLTEINMIVYDKILWMYINEGEEVHRLCFGDEKGNIIRIRFTDETEMRNVWDGILEEVPWIFCGDTDENYNIFYDNRVMMADAIKRRKAQMLGQQEKVERSVVCPICQGNMYSKMNAHRCNRCGYIYFESPVAYMFDSAMNGGKEYGL